MSKPRAGRILIGLLLCAVLVVGAVVAWRAWQVNRELNGAVQAATSLESAVRQGDDASAETALDQLRRHSTEARDLTSGLSWRLLGTLPVIGDDARGVRTVSAVTAQLSADGIEPLLVTAKDLDNVLPREGRIDPQAVRDLQEPVAAAETAFVRADDLLSRENPEDFIARFAIRYRELSSRVSEAADILTSAGTAVEVLPAMLGEDGDRNYLLVFQNNAEVRATGGLPGAVSVIQARDGRIELTKQVAANSFGRTEEPVLPLSPAEEAIYDTQLGTYFLDANFTPDFPRAADLMKARWEQVYEEELDGIFSMDVLAVSYILRATGPVEVEGRSLTADNVVDELLHEVYLRFEAPARQDEFFRNVARTVFDRVSTGIKEPEELAGALSEAASEGRLLFHSFRPPVQEVLAGTQIAGELATDAGSSPQVGVYLNDGTGSKMSYFLRYDARVSANYCVDGQQGLTGHATLRSQAPANAAELPGYITGGGSFGTDPGDQTVFVRLYGPVGGRISQVRAGSRPLEPLIYDLDGRPVATLAILLKPRSTTDLSWRMVSGDDQTGDVQVSVTPGIKSGAASSETPSACL